MLIQSAIKPVLIALICMVAASANAATNYVAPNGSDGNSGAINSPFVALEFKCPGIRAPWRLRQRAFRSAGRVFHHRHREDRGRPLRS
jgi:hypothetical protein